MFNIVSAFFIHSGIFGGIVPGAAESGIIATANLTNMSIQSNLDSTQQFQISSNIIGVIAQGITFDWIFWYLPKDLQDAENIQGLRAMLFVVAMLINSLAVVEFIMGRNNTVGG
jgi:hypothetical protein